MSSDNPFAALSDGRPGDGDTIQREAAPIDFFGLFGRALSLITDNLEVLLVPMVVLIALNLASLGLSLAVTFGADQVGDELVRLGVQLTSQVVSIVFALINLYLSMGFYRMLLRLDRGQEVDQDALWGEGSNFLSGIGTAILMAIIVGMLWIPAIITWIFSAVAAVMTGLESGDITSAVGVLFGGLFVALLLAIPGYIVQLGLQFSVIAVVDLDGNPIEALMQSWRVTNGRKLFLFGQALVAGLLVLTLYAVTCLFGAPLAVIGMIALQVVTYNAFKHAAEPQTSAW